MNIKKYIEIYRITMLRINRKTTKYKSEPGSVDIIFEINERNERDESNKIPVIIKPEPEEKRKKSLN